MDVEVEHFLQSKHYSFWHHFNQMIIFLFNTIFKLLIYETRVVFWYIWETLLEWVVVVITIHYYNELLVADKKTAYDKLDF